MNLAYREMMTWKVALIGLVIIGAIIFVLLIANAVKK